MSLHSMVSRGAWGRIGQRPIEADASVDSLDDDVDQTGPRIQDVRLPGASMRLLEAGLALSAIATAILIGVGR